MTLYSRYPGTRLLFRLMTSSLVGNTLSSVIGNIRIDEAKIGGMTPAVLTFNGR